MACNILKAQDPTVKDLQKDATKSIKKDEKDTIPQKWKLGGNFSLTINQGALSNWSAGGEEFSFSLNSYMNLYAFYKEANTAGIIRLTLPMALYKQLRWVTGKQVTGSI
jgi:hypothetical protein